MTAHRQATMGRIRKHAVVLCLQDTTKLDYNGQAMTCLGPLSKPSADCFCTRLMWSRPSASRWR